MAARSLMHFHFIVVRYITKNFVAGQRITTVGNYKVLSEIDLYQFINLFGVDFSIIVFCGLNILLLLAFLFRLTLFYHPHLLHIAHKQVLLLGLRCFLLQNNIYAIRQFHLSVAQCKKQIFSLVNAKVAMQLIIY